MNWECSMSLRQLHEWAEEQDWNHIAQDDYEDQDEHWYVVSEWFGGEDLERFREWRDFIDRNGETAFYNGKPFDYVQIDGWKYWITQSYFNNSLVLNRRKVEDDEA